MHKGRILPGKTCKVNHSMIHFLLYCGQRYLNKIHASDFPDRVNLIKIHSVPPPKSAPCRPPPGGGHRYPHCRKGRATGPRWAACGPARRRRMPCRETNLLRCLPRRASATSPGAPPTPGCCASPVTGMTVMTAVTMIPADPLYRLVRYRLVKRVRPPYRHRRHHRHRGRITVASMGFVLPTGNPSPRRTPPLLRGRPRAPISHGRLLREKPHRGHQRAGDTG